MTAAQQILFSAELHREESQNHRDSESNHKSMIVKRARPELQTQLSWLPRRKHVASGVMHGWSKYPCQPLNQPYNQIIPGNHCNHGFRVYY
jgi:hypothetical protein